MKFVSKQENLLQNVLLDSPAELVEVQNSHRILLEVTYTTLNIIHTKRIYLPKKEMTTFDALFYHVFQHYKNRKSKKANSIAVFYITFLQCSLLLVLGVFFAGFFRSMHVETMSAGKVWTLFALAVIFIHFKNWMKYGGRKRKVLNAKMLKNKKLNYSIWFLWLLPLGILGLAFVLLQAV